MSIVGVSGVSSAWAAGASSYGTEAGGGHADRLDVGRVVARRAAHVGVLADVGAGQELLRLRAAHRPRGRLDDHVVEAETIEDPDVGVAVGLVRRVEPGVVDVEGVGVLHHELPPAQDSRAGPLLVAVLVLDLVDPQRQVLVRRVEVLHHQGEHLLVRGAEEVVAALAVLEPEDVAAVLRPAVGGVVRLLGQQRREEQLLGTHRVHLVADDLLDLAQHPQSEREPGVDARSGSSDVAGAHQQPVAGHLRVVGVLAQGPHEEGRHPQDHGRKATGGGRRVAIRFRSEATICPRVRPSSSPPPTNRTENDPDDTHAPGPHAADRRSLAPCSVAPSSAARCWRPPRRPPRSSCGWRPDEGPGALRALRRRRRAPRRRASPSRCPAAITRLVGKAGDDYVVQGYHQTSQLERVVRVTPVGPADHPRRGTSLSDATLAADGASFVASRSSRPSARCCGGTTPPPEPSRSSTRSRTTPASSTTTARRPSSAASDRSGRLPGTSTPTTSGD